MGHDLTPLELDALRRCVERGGTRCNDGGLVDTLLSGLCSKPVGSPYITWRMNPHCRTDGYHSLYEPTDAGRAALASQDQGGGDRG